MVFGNGSLQRPRSSNTISSNGSFADEHGSHIMRPVLVEQLSSSSRATAQPQQHLCTGEASSSLSPSNQAVPNTTSPRQSTGPSSTIGEQPSPAQPDSMTQQPSSSSVCSTAQNLRSKCRELQKLDTTQLEGRIRCLQDLLRLDAHAACDLCQAVPSLLQHDRRALAKQLAQVRRTLSCETEDDARRLCILAPLLLVLPPQRVDACVTQLAEALRVPPHTARGLVRMLPQLPTLDPSTLAAKLDCLCRILDPGCKPGSGPGQGATASSPSSSSSSKSSSSSGGRDASAGSHGGSSATGTQPASRAAAASPEAPPATASGSQQACLTDSSSPSSQQQQQQQPSAAATRALSRTLLAYPRLLTFSTKELKRHHIHLCQTLTLTHQQAAVLLAQDPWLLTMSPRSLSEKVQLLYHLLGCPSSKPEVLHRLLFRRPAVLARSLTKISCTCRSLSIWRFNPRSFKLRMVMARPSLMELHPHEMLGRCRWLRRFMLSNGFYHTALRRLPPNLLAMVVAMLPGSWSRLQYLAESEQEGAMGLVETVECRQAVFEQRFPEYLKWREWKIKQMVSGGCSRGVEVAARGRVRRGGCAAAFRGFSMLLVCAGLGPLVVA